MILRKLHIVLFLLAIAIPAAAQNDRRIEEQKKVINDLEKKIADGERELSTIKQGKTATEDRVKRTTRQIDTRNQLLEATEEQVGLLSEELHRTDSVAGRLTTSLEQHRTRYAEMVREAYRSHKHNDYITYLFTSRNLGDMARKLANLRTVSEKRAVQLRQIDSLSHEVSAQKALLDTRKRALDAETAKLQKQRETLQRDARNARNDLNRMSKREKETLRRKMAQEQQLDVAINELRRLTKGNKEGDSFSSKTSGLRLPVTGGRVKKYKENMAEVVGPRGAQVISIYDGKVIEIKRNRITNKYDVYVAHGEYLTSYANMGSICVEKGQKVAKNQALGTIGSSIDILTMETEYKLVFGIYPPNANQRMLAEHCFRK